VTVPLQSQRRIAMETFGESKKRKREEEEENSTISKKKKAEIQGMTP